MPHLPPGFRPLLTHDERSFLDRILSFLATCADAVVSLSPSLARRLKLYFTHFGGPGLPR